MRSARIALIALFSLAAPAAFAGEGNEAYFVQLSPEGTIYGNTLTIAQDAADYSLVRGINPNLVAALLEDVPGGSITATIGTYVLNTLVDADPLRATQRGESNRATLEFSGAGGELQLLQSSGSGAAWTPGGAAGDNVAEIVATGNSLGGVVQIGSLNEATLGLDNSTGLISQLGDGLTATLNVGPGGSGMITQIGNNSDAGTVNVVAGTSVIYTQYGDNLSQSGQVTAYSSNPGDIVITQIGW